MKGHTKKFVISRVRYIENSQQQKKIQLEKPPIISGKRRQDRNANISSFLSRTLKLHKKLH